MSRAGLPRQSEASFQAQVEQLAAMYGWKVYHTRYSFGSSKGFPDLVLLKPPRLIFAELKRDGKWATTDQDKWLNLLTGVPGVEVYVWRPSGWDGIVDVLRGD